MRKALQQELIIKGVEKKALENKGNQCPNCNSKEAYPTERGTNLESNIIVQCCLCPDCEITFNKYYKLYNIKITTEQD